MQNNIKQGLKDGIPIALGYFSVSFTFGMLAVNHGMKPFHAVLISLLNLTSAGQFAGLNVILAGSSLVEMALTQLVINMRYALMSLSLSQKFARSVHTGHRLAIAYGITDEIFAVASSKKGKVGQWLGIRNAWRCGGKYNYAGIYQKCIGCCFIRNVCGDCYSSG